MVIDFEGMLESSGYTVVIQKIVNGNKFVREFKHVSAGLYKPGGKREATSRQLYECIEHAKTRHKEILELLKQSAVD